MEQAFANISLPVAFAAALSSMVVGAIWYHPKVFGNAWMASIGKTEKDFEGGNMAVIFGVAYLMSVVLAQFLQISIELLHYAPAPDGGVRYSFHTFKHGALHGAMFALGMVAPVLIIKNLFARRSFVSNTLVHIGYWVVVMAIMGGVVDAF